MRILLDCRPLQYAGTDSELSRMIFSGAAGLVSGEPVEWLYLVDHHYRPGSISWLSDRSVLVCRAFPGKPGWRWWYGRQVPRLAKRYKADRVMLTGGMAAALPVPQYIWMPGIVDRRDRRLAVTLSRAAGVFCFSERDRSFLASRQPGMEDRIVLVRPEPDGVIAPLSPGEREEAKSSFAGGKEYFLAVMTGARLEGVLNLLKAFSLFKKRQLSNMQLVIVLRDRISGKDAKEKLTTYKYREDLHWVDLWQEGMRASQQDELRKMTGAAYALLFPFAGDGLGVPIVNAWKAWVPVIAGPGGNNREIGGEAVLYGDPEDLAELAGQMMLIYKDEVRRNGLIEKGRDRLYSFQEDRPGTAVWKAIQKIN